MLTPEQIETIDHNARIIIDGHVAAVHGVTNGVLQKLTPGNKHEYGKHFEALIAGTLQAFSELGYKAANEGPRAVLALKPDLNEQDRDEVLAIWRRRLLDADLYRKRLESFKASFGRRMQGYGTAVELSTFRFDLIESRYLAGTANASRLVVAKLKNALDLRVYSDREQPQREPPVSFHPSMMTNYSFKKHALTADQRLWLAEVGRASPAFSPRAARIALQGRVSPIFSPDAIDPRLYANRRLTPVGLWHVDPNSPRLDAIDKTIRAIRERILQQPDLKSITAAEIAGLTGLTEVQVGEALFAAGELGSRFFSTADGVSGNPVAYAKLELPDDDSADDEYLNYTSIEDLLERFYTRRGKALRNAISYSEREGIVDHRTTYTAAAARAVYRAIRLCIEHDGRAHAGNVPREAETILLEISGGTIDTAEANRQVQQAISGLSQEEGIDAPIERFGEWGILKPLESGSSSMSSNRVFVVHGHNGEAKESVARFVEKLDLEAIILHERPNKGRTIITKFQEESDGVGFAVVLMTPDDEGRAANAANAKARARQNVVFELGFFIGKLGPERVAALVKGDIEKPSDFDGVVYISLDAADWRLQLANELKAAGLAGDWSKVLA